MKGVMVAIVYLIFHTLLVLPRKYGAAEKTDGNGMVFIEEEQLVVGKKIDMWKALRKFSSKNVLLVTTVLYESCSSTFKELRENTHLTTGQLNSTLIEMRNADLVVLQDGVYYLTRYGATLISALRRMKHEMSLISSDKLLKPVEGDPMPAVEEDPIPN